MDASKVKSVVIWFMIVISLPFILGFSFIGLSEYWMFYIVVSVIGLTLGGSYGIVAVVTASELSEPTSSRATVIGIINGSGSLGAGIGQIIVRLM